MKKILIANRGEIACRVIKTAKRLGIATVAVHSDADRDALHVLMADEAVAIGPASSAESYLVTANILAAIEQTGADAVHPGYGFLSENAEFARTLEAAGIIFIGPGPDAITAMGDKITSKKIAEAAGVNTVPGHLEPVVDADDAVKIARRIGYPVMLKASAGGGGKGMRIARNDAECRDGLLRAMNEARSSFGDDRVFVEKYIEQPRHIEIQVLADSHGNCIHLGERECSIQRRHQKVIEEAPSPFLDAATRQAMGEQAVALAKAVAYRSAGTVEFIVDQQRNFFFLEMNTRLQVEHPVTEMVTGLDLVEQMLCIADGQHLGLKQEDVTFTGWAVETRIYAEDPFRGFLPSGGRLVRYRAPPESASVRVDSGVYEGAEISLHYDPMIAKLVTHGSDRASAIDAMSHALDGFVIRGPAHNIPFLAALMMHPRFREGRLSTDFIADEYPGGFDAADVTHDDPRLLVAVAAALHHAHQTRASAISGQVEGHRRQISGEWVVVMDGVQYPVRAAIAGGGHDVTVDGQLFELRSDWRLGDLLFEGTAGGAAVCIQVEHLAVGFLLLHAGTRARVLVLAPHVAALNAWMPEKEAPDTSRFLLSPMPGLLVSVAVAAGDAVKAGQEICVVEAMKMENLLQAGRDGIIGAVHAAPGDILAVDQAIVEFE